MDWQIIEISAVTVLALWVALFAGNTFSRVAAGVMLVLNLLWIIFEREKPRETGPEGADRRPQSDRAAAGLPVPPPPSPATLASAAAPTAPAPRRNPRIL